MVRAVIDSISGYPGFFAACATSGLLVPVPEDVPLLYAGTRVATSGWSLYTVVFLGIVGVGIRDLGAFWLGRTLGSRVLQSPFFRRLWREDRMARAQDMVRMRGAWAVLIGRFFVGFRAPVFFAAGAVGVPVRTFVAVDLVGLALAVPLTVVLGVQFGEPSADFAVWALRRVHHLVAATVAGVLAVFIVRSMMGRLRTFWAGSHQR